MINNWNYVEVSDNLKAGEYRVRIASVEECISASSGNDMLKIVFDVSGSTKKLNYYIVFLPDRPEVTNRNLTKFFDSFDIEKGNFNIQSWVGKVGACRVEIDGEGYPKVQYLLYRKSQAELPAWQELDGVPAQPQNYNEVATDDFPF